VLITIAFWFSDHGAAVFIALVAVVVIALFAVIIRSLTLYCKQHRTQLVSSRWCWLHGYRKLLIGAFCQNFKTSLLKIGLAILDSKLPDDGCSFSHIFTTWYPKSLSQSRENWF